MDVDARKLHAEVQAVSAEVHALRECMLYVGALRQDQYLAALHRRLFAQKLMAHPLGLCRGWTEALDGNGNLN